MKVNWDRVFVVGILVWMLASCTYNVFVNESPIDIDATVKQEKIECLK